MREKIENKIQEKVEYILSKNVEKISGEEIAILESQLLKIENVENEEEMKKRNKEMAELLVQAFLK